MYLLFTRFPRILSGTYNFKQPVHFIERKRDVEKSNWKNGQKTRLKRATVTLFSRKPVGEGLIFVHWTRGG